VTEGAGTSGWAGILGLLKVLDPWLGGFTLRVMRDGRSVTVEVTADGVGLVSHAGAVLLSQAADKVGLTRALSARLAGLKQRRRGHDPGRVIRDLAVMLADGGECVSDLGAVREQDVLFGTVASDSTAFRMIDRIASTPGLLDGSVTRTRGQASGSGICMARPSG
jgi:Transposase DDE domain group 1